MAQYNPPGYNPGYAQQPPPGYQQYQHGPPPPQYPPQYAPPPPQYPPQYAPPPQAAPGVSINISNNSVQQTNTNGGRGGVTVGAAPPPRAAAPARAQAATIGLFVRLGDPSHMSPTNLVNWMAEATAKAYQKLENDEASSGDIVKLMSEVLVAVESLTIKLSVGSKALVANDEFRGQFLTGVRSVQRLIEAARERVSCCCYNYMGDDKLKRVCEKVWQQLATFSMNNFRLDLSTTGHVGIVGHSGVDYKQSMQAVHEVDTLQAVVPAPLVHTERDPLLP